MKRRAKIAAVVLPGAVVAFAGGVATPAGSASAANCNDAITLINYYVSVGDCVTAAKIAGYTPIDMADTGCT